MATKSCDLVAQRFCCKICDYKTSKKSSYEKHLSTSKHTNATNDYNNTTKNCEKVSKDYICNCGKKYSHHSSLWKHEKKCNVKETDFNDEPQEISDKKLILELLKSNNELQKQILELCKEKNVINNTNTNTNCHNNTNNFNLQFFLNEQCKDALNIEDFINQLQIKTSDLDMVGRVGYTEGISKIFVRGLKELDVFKRPLHCSDLKREVLYVKDKDAWEKDGEDKKTMKNAIKFIAAKNFNQLTDWIEDNPEYNDYDSKKHKEYHNIIIKASGGATPEEDESNYNKIIRNVARESVIDKSIDR
jgi:hypothetical protein